MYIINPYNNVESNENNVMLVEEKKNWEYSIIQLELCVQPYANSISNKPQRSRPILIEIGYALKHILIA